MLPSKALPLVLHANKAWQWRFLLVCTNNVVCMMDEDVNGWTWSLQMYMCPTFMLQLSGQSLFYPSCTDHVCLS